MIGEILSAFGEVPIFKQIYDWIRRPILEVYYDSNETYLKARILNLPNTPVGLYCHLMVKNIGKSSAVDCIAYLVSIEQLKSGSFEKIREYRNVMQLKWAHELDYSPKDIDVDTPVRLDVCYVYGGSEEIHFATMKFPNGSQTDFPAGIYRIKVRIKSKNAKAIDGIFEVKYTAGKFDSLHLNRYSEN